MSLNFSRRLTGNKRSHDADRMLGWILAFIAGAANAGGFLAVHQYTSHMTGIVSAVADHIALGAYTLVLAGIGAFLSFLIGAACCAILVNYSRRHKMHSEYAFPLLLEAVFLLVFGFMGARLSQTDFLDISVTVMLLCFIMGLQNAVITKLSNAVIRTTHVTGIVTDLGIELGKLTYWNVLTGEDVRPVSVNRERLLVLTLLLVCFFMGGVIGAFGFKHVGYSTTLPLALILIGLAFAPVLDDVRHRRH